MTLAEFEQYIKIENKKHIIFDFDETICTLHIDWKKWKDDLEKMIQRYDADFSMTKVDGLAKMQNSYVKKFGKEFRDDLVNFNREAEKKYYSRFSIVPHALQLLNISTENAELYIWTTNDRATITPILQELKIDRLFTKIVGRNDLTCIKPDPEGFLHIYTEGQDKSSYLFIGDSGADQEASRQAGIDFLSIGDIKE